MSEKIKDDGGPAFPSDWKDFQPTTGEQVVREQFQGMTLRDYFAAQVAASFLGRVPCNDGRTVGEMYDAIADGAYSIADAMLKARSHD